MLNLVLFRIRQTTLINTVSNLIIYTEMKRQQHIFGMFYVQCNNLYPAKAFNEMIYILLSQKYINL